MLTHQFNCQRIMQLKELLEIQYDKLHSFERELELAAGADQRISIRQQIKWDLTPRLRQNEQEYAELLVATIRDDDIPEDKAGVIVTELVEATSRAELSTNNAPEGMLRLLCQIKEKLDEPGKSATAKLKIALPIVPLLASYELEMDTENFITKVWRKAQVFLERLIAANPQ
jgi:hypothetical protein